MVSYKISFLYPGEDNDDIQRCLLHLFSTPVGTVPLDRDFGIDNSFLDNPFPIARNLLAVELVEKIEKYEPRVSVEDLKFKMDSNGRMDVEVLVKCTNM